MAATAVGLVEPARTVTATVDPRRRALTRLNTRAQQRYRARRAAAGVPLRRDPAPVAEILRRLRKRGWTWAEIARASDMNYNQLWAFRRRLAEGRPVLSPTWDRFHRLWEEVQPPEEVSLSPEPLARYITVRFGSLKEAGVHAQIGRLRGEWRAGKGLTRRQAEWWASRYGLIEWELWPELLP